MQCFSSTYSTLSAGFSTCALLLDNTFIPATIEYAIRTFFRNYAWIKVERERIGRWMKCMKREAYPASPRYCMHSMCLFSMNNSCGPCMACRARVPAAYGYPKHPPYNGCTAGMLFKRQSECVYLYIYYSLSLHIYYSPSVTHTHTHTHTIYYSLSLYLSHILLSLCRTHTQTHTLSTYIYYSLSPYLSHAFPCIPVLSSLPPPPYTP